MKSAVGSPSRPGGLVVNPEPDISATTVKPYKVDDQLVNQELELKHGESIKRFPMDKISNGRFETVRGRVTQLLTFARVCPAERIRTAGQVLRE